MSIPNKQTFPINQNISITIPDAEAYSYNIVNGVVEVVDENGDHVVMATAMPRRYTTWTVADKEDWANYEIKQRYLRKAITVLMAKLKELDTIYDSYMLGRVYTSDNNMFNAAKDPGGSGTRSLQNTINLIKNGVELALFAGATNIVLSDGNNNDVVYVFDTNSSTPQYILPIVEIGTYLGKLFEIKRQTRNTILAWLNQPSFDFVAGREFDILEQFRTFMGTEPDGTLIE